MAVTLFPMRMKHIYTLFVFTAILSGTSGCAYLNGSFQTVEHQHAYRSGQLHSQALQRRLNELDVQTVVSLRKPAPRMQWYRDEVEVCRVMNVEHVSLGWSKNALPTPESLQKYVDLIEDANKPILMHCQGGVHRSSIAAAVYVLCRTGDRDAARAQIHPHFNNAPIGQLLDLYDDSPLPFPQWVNEVYPDVYAATVTPARTHSP